MTILTIGVNARNFVLTLSINSDLNNNTNNAHKQ